MIVGFIEIWRYLLHHYDVNLRNWPTNLFRSESILIPFASANWIDQPVYLSTRHMPIYRVHVIVTKATRGIRNKPIKKKRRGKKEKRRNEQCLEPGGSRAFFFHANNKSCLPYRRCAPYYLDLRVYEEPFASACRKHRTSITEHGSGYKMVSPYSRCTAA